jgi:hypothetical protein
MIDEKLENSQTKTNGFGKFLFFSFKRSEIKSSTGFHLSNTKTSKTMREENKHLKIY